MIRPSSDQARLRGLHDSGRQSSLDSGIGIATGSQSSYSGSFSSCTGSLDTASQGGGEEFGSLLSLPPPPPPLPPPPPPLSLVTSDLSPAAPCSCPSRTGSSAPRRQAEEYQVPNLRLRYDTPRNLLQSWSLPDPTLAQGGAPQWAQDRRSCGGGDGGGGGGSDTPSDPSLQRARPALRQASCGSEMAPPVDNDERCTIRSLLLPGCPVCGGIQVTELFT